MNKLEVANRIIEARKEKNLTQVALAQEIGVSYQAIQKWEVAETLPRAKRLEVLGKVLGKEPQWFMFGDLGVAKAGELMDELQDLQDRIDQAASCLKAADQLEGQERNNLICAARRLLENS